jgi:site-specific recombinase XerD
MIQNGVQPKAVQDLLDHSTYAGTMDTYVHTNAEMLREAVNKGKAIGEAITAV